MNRIHLSKASLLMVTLAVIACGQESLPEPQPEGSAASQKQELSLFKALILRRTVQGGTQSPEYRAAHDMGLDVTLASDTEWAQMTPAEFASYRVIILGDANCASLDVASAALANRHVWGPVVNGNILVAGTAPVANGADFMTREGHPVRRVHAGPDGPVCVPELLLPERGPQHPRGAAGAVR